MKRLKLGRPGAAEIACLVLVAACALKQLPVFSCQTQDEQTLPQVIQSASHLSLDGLSLVLVFDRQVNLSEPIEWVERQKASQRWIPSRPQAGSCELSNSTGRPSSELKVAGIQVCAKLLSRKTLKLLHKFKLYNCIWASRVQLLIELGKPAAGPLKLSLAPWSSLGGERELSVELNKLPLESMGVPLVPRLALTGPNQVPPCGEFSLNAHLSSPFGTEGGESVRLSWSVERLGLQLLPSQAENSSRPSSEQADELAWQALRDQVTRTTSNNLLLDAALLQQAPQVYEFKLTASFLTQLTSLTLNATHRLSRLDYDTPIGSIYGTHMLQNWRSVNPSEDLLLLAELQVPDCAPSVKQVGLYWQVSDSRVAFEQTYAPFYLARANSLPELLDLEFRLNLFYGVRVKRSATASVRLASSELQPDAPISQGLLVSALQASSTGHLELAASSSSPDRYTHLWSCFDGKTAHTCYRGLAPRPLSPADTSSNSTRYELAAASQSAALGAANSDGALQAGSPLVEPASRSQPVLRLPLAWLEPDAQLWFGLQRFDRRSQQASSASGRTEYALVSVRRAPSPTARAPSVALGPVLLGRARVRTTLRNPLTGAIVLSAGAPAVVVGRLGPSHLVRSFAWDAPDLVQPIHWSARNVTNELTGDLETLTELHLDGELQVAHAHLQVRLTACSHSGTSITASLALDVVPGVGECKVSLRVRHGSPLLQVSADLCNLPAKLAPASYQLYLVPAEPTRPANSAQSGAEHDEHLSESDEEQLQARWQALSVPQLTPVFRLPLGAVSPGARLAVRVCDRLQACRAFFSASQQLAGLLTPDSAGGSASPALARSALAERARRAQLAGNSLVALADTLPVLDLLGASGSPEPADLQAAARDALNYCAQALQRQFHFTDSGQSSLAARAMARLLGLGQLGIDLKFRAARLLSQLARKSLSEQMNLKTSCAPDWRSIELAYDSLMATFSHYSIITAPSGFATDTTASQPKASSSQPAGLQAAKKRDEAILAYLKSIRLAARSLLAAAASQLNLGEQRQLIYRSSAPLQPLVDTNRTTSSSIVSKLAHLTQLPESVSVDLTRDFGTKLALAFDQQLLAKLNRRAQSGQLKCANVTARSTRPPQAGLCSSFVLVVSSFAGKAPFRALDDGPALRLPAIEVSLLSPLDGSDLSELNDELAASLSSLTFTYSARESTSVGPSSKRAHSSPKRAFKCYQFDELANEWTRKSTAAELADQLADDGHTRLLRCSLSGLGTLAAFQGRPPATESALSSLPVGLGTGALLGLLALLSLLACLATSLRSDKSSASGTNGADHPEQSQSSYQRNNFNYPALAGRI